MIRLNNLPSDQRLGDGMSPAGATSKIVKKVVQALLSVIFLGVAVVQVVGGALITLNRAIPETPIPNPYAIGIPGSITDFLLLYGMFSPDEQAASDGAARMERQWGSGVFAVQARTEIWVELERGGFYKLPALHYFPDPRDEKVLLRHKKLRGRWLPHSLRQKGETAESVFGREVMNRHNILNPHKRARAVYVRIIRWPAGGVSALQHYAGEQITYSQSLSDISSNAAWGRSEFKKIWPR